MDTQLKYTRGNQTMLTEEKIDVNKLNFIVQNRPLFEDKIKEFRALQGKTDESDYTLSQFSICKKILEKSTNGIFKVKYVQKEGVGRFQAEGSQSLQNMTRQIRHTIASEFYNDIDIVNCHPNLLVELCKTHHIEHTTLKKYCENRPKFLTDAGLSVETGKVIFLSIMNGGSKEYLSIENPSPEIKYFYEHEIKGIHKRLTEIFPKDYQKRVKRNLKNNKNYNHEGSFMNILLCNLENQILQAMYAFYNEPKNAVLCFDGLMLPKIIEPKIEALTTFINNKFNLNLEFKIKEMKEGFDLSGYTIEPYVDSMEEATDAQLASILKERASGILIEGRKDFYIWNDRLLLWEKINLKKAMCYAFNVLMVNITSPKITSNSGRKNIWALTDIQDYDFEDKMDLPNLRWLYIRDGMAYNMETGELRKRTNKDYCSFELTCGFTDDTTMAQDYLNSLMIKDGDDTRLHILLKYSAYCFTDLMLKLFGIFISEVADCGKSTFIDFLSHLFGSFKSAVDESAFNNKTNHQTGLWNAVYKKKLSVLVEPKTKSFDEEIIKKVVGNDTQQFRVAGADKVNDYTISTKMIIGTNKKIILSGEGAIADKILYIGFPNRFEKTAKNQAQIELLKNTPIFYDGLFTIIMKYALELYKDREIKGIDDKYSRSNIYDWIEEECSVKVGDDKLRYSVKEAYQNYSYWCKDGMIKEDKKFFKKTLIELTGKETKSAQVKDFKGDLKILECYFGIRSKDSENNE